MKKTMAMATALALGLALASCEKAPVVGDEPGERQTGFGERAAEVAQTEIDAGRDAARVTRTTDAPPKSAHGVECFRLADAELTVIARPPRIVSSKAFALLGLLAAEARLLPRKVRHKPLDEALRELTGVGPADMESVTFELSFTRRMRDVRFLLTAVTLQPVDQVAVVTQIMESTGEKLNPLGRHAGVSVYGFGRGDEAVIAFVEPRLVVLGSPLAVRVGLENHAAGRPAQVRVPVEKSLASAPKGSDVVVAFVPPAEAVREIAEEWAHETRTDGKPLLEMETLSANAKLGEQVEIEGRVSFRSEVAARAAASAETFRRNILAELVDDVPPEFRFLVDALRGLKIEGGADVLTASARFGIDEAALADQEVRRRGRPDRRARSNETAAVAALRTYLAAQSQFHRTDFYDKGFLTYANPKDGKGFPDLYQIGGPGSGGAVLKLMDLSFAKATTPERARAGYCFVDLVYDDYTVDCGLCAVPAEYGETGVHTFIIDVTGVVYRTDNGGKPLTSYPANMAGWVPVGSDPSRPARRRRRAPVLFKSQLEVLKMKSASNLKQIGYGCHLWSADHDEQFPPSLQALLEKRYIKDRKVFECPAQPGGTGYVYVKGLKAADRPDLVLAHEKDGCFTDGRNALFIGGNVQWMSDGRFRAALKKTRDFLRSKGRKTGVGGEELF